MKDGIKVLEANVKQNEKDAIEAFKRLPENFSTQLGMKVNALTQTGGYFNARYTGANYNPSTVATTLNEMKDILSPLLKADKNLADKFKNLQNNIAAYTKMRSAESTYTPEARALNSKIQSNLEEVKESYEKRLNEQHAGNSLVKKFQENIYPNLKKLPVQLQGRMNEIKDKLEILVATHPKEMQELFNSVSKNIVSSVMLDNKRNQRAELHKDLATALNDKLKNKFHGASFTLHNTNSDGEKEASIRFVYDATKISSSEIEKLKAELKRNGVDSEIVFDGIPEKTLVQISIGDGYNKAKVHEAINKLGSVESAQLPNKNQNLVSPDVIALLSAGRFEFREDGSMVNTTEAQKNAPMPDFKTLGNALNQELRSIIPDNAQSKYGVNAGFVYHPGSEKNSGEQFRFPHDPAKPSRRLNLVREELQKIGIKSEVIGDNNHIMKFSLENADRLPSAKQIEGAFKNVAKAFEKMEEAHKQQTNTPTGSHASNQLQRRDSKGTQGFNR